MSDGSSSPGPTLTRRRFLTLAAEAALSLPLLAGCSPGSGNPTPQPGVSPGPTGTPGAALPQPREFVSQNGVLSASLLIKMRPYTVAGQPLTLRSYGAPRSGVANPDPNQDADWDWSFPGPTLRVNPGDTIQLNLYNYLPPQQPLDACEPQFYPTAIVQTDSYPDCYQENNVTNLHFHGMHVPVGAQGDDVFLSIYPNGQTGLDQAHGHQMPGERMLSGAYRFEFQVPKDHPQGTYWYHPHHHGATDIQVVNGLAGTIVVQDTSADMRRYAEQVLVIQGISETLPFPTGSGTGPTLTLNGVPIPAGTRMQAGEVQRWRLVNATGNIDKAFQISFDGPPDAVPEVFLIAVDGVYITEAKWSSERSTPYLYLAPGNRIDVLVRARREGRFSLKARSLLPARPRGRADAATPAVGNALELLTLDVQGSVAPMPLPLKLPALPEQLRPIQDQEIVKTRTLRMQLIAGKQGGAPSGQAPKFVFDGQPYDPNVISQRMTAGTAEEWTIINETTVSHPFHIHVNPFFITAYTPAGGGQATPTPAVVADFNPVGYWQDTLMVPQASFDKDGKLVAPGSVTFRQRYPCDVQGAFVLHCHILGHEDRGMMQNVEIIAGGTCGAT